MNQPIDILVVDDHAENILALKATLNRPDYRVITASSGSEALKQVLRHDFAVIVLDVMMPEMDGFDTAALIRSREATRHVPIIFLTANSSDVSQIYRAYAVGAVDYLVKPIEPEVVRSKVAVFVDLHKKTQQIRRQEEQLREAQRLRGERALRQSEALYEATFTDAAIGIAHATAEGRWLRSNRRLREILGRSDEEMLKLDLDDIIHPDERPEMARLREQLLAGSLGSSCGEVRCRDKAGRTVWTNLTVSMLGGASDGEANDGTTFIVVMEDITERKHNEQRQRFLTRASEVLLQSLDLSSTLREVARLLTPAFGEWCSLHVAGDGDRELTIVETATEQPDLNKELRKTMATDEVPEGIVAISGAASAAGTETNGHPTAAPAVTLERLRGVACRSLLAVPISARGVRLGSISIGSSREGRHGNADLEMLGELAHRLAFAIENARLYAQAQTGLEARNIFLSVASHELRTPLTPLLISFQRLLGMAGTLPFERTSPEKVREMMVRCERQIRRLTSLVDTLLDVSRIAAGALRLEPSRFDLGEVVRDVVARFSDQASEVGSSLALRADNPVVGTWDRLRIEQVVTNLVSNAVKYGNGQDIEVRLEQQNGHAKLTVQDHGIGIEQDRLSNIFDRFERAPSALAYGGLGLGLYIARQLINEHSGSIDVDSQPGQGARFTVTLPVA